MDATAGLRPKRRRLAPQIISKERRERALRRLSEVWKAEKEKRRVHAYSVLSACEFSRSDDWPRLRTYLEFMDGYTDSLWPDWWKAAETKAGASDNEEENEEEEKKEEEEAVEKKCTV